MCVPMDAALSLRTSCSSDSIRPPGFSQSLTPPQASRLLSRIPPSLGFQLDCHSEKEAKAVLQESWNGGSLTPDGHGKNPCSPEIRYLTHNLAMLQLILVLSLFITPLGWFESARSMHTFNSSWNEIFAF